MGESNHWGPPRYLALLAVLMLHVAFIAALLMAPRSGGLAASPVHSVELLFLPPVDSPRVRLDSAHPRRLSSDRAITIAPPVLDASSLPPPGASSSEGTGSGVDWAAEARRALQAFEIRSHQAPTNSSVSGGPADDNWWPHARHHAGDRFKTANGDWVVWISENCYQVAGSNRGAYASSSTLHQIVCPPQSATPRTGQ
jgi:hypothetical protein